MTASRSVISSAQPVPGSRTVPTYSPVPPQHSCLRCGSFKFRARFDHGVPVYSCSGCGHPVDLSAGAGEAYRDYALAQLIFSARVLAFVHLERGGKICGGGVVHPICDQCRAEVPSREDAVHHLPDCPVGRVLAWLDALTSFSPFVVVPPAVAASAAGDFSALNEAIEREIRPVDVAALQAALRPTQAPMAADYTIFPAEPQEAKPCTFEDLWGVAGKHHREDAIRDVHVVVEDGGVE